MEKEIQRQIRLLKLLSSEKKWFTTIEISEILGCSNKTVMKDISRIKDFLPLDWDIKSRKGKGICLYMPLSTSSKEVSSLLFRESLTFQILDLLFKGNVKTSISLARILYVQASTLPCILKRVENYLKTFRLKFERKSLKVVGDEIQIIEMYYDLYLKSYKHSEWPFQGYNQGKIFRYLEQLEELLGISLHLCSRRNLSYYIAIWLKRKQQGYQINSKENFLYYYVDTSFYKRISSIESKLKKDYHINLTKQDKIFLIFVIKRSKYVYKDINKQKNENLYDLIKMDKHFFGIVNEFICMLENKLEEELIHDEKFIFSLIEYFKRTLCQLRYLPVIEKRQEITTKYVKEKYSVSFFKIKEIYIQWANKNNIADYITDEEIAKITMYIEARKIRYNLIYKKVYLVTGECESWTEYLLEILKRRFGEAIQISIKFFRDVSIKQEELNVNFIISTIPLYFDLIPVVIIQPIPTERDFANIKYFIDL
ncbi:BglG family transcription antiterminator [Bacillus cereus]|uniref:Capsule biosynthesis protein n=1 Tax=Bacillus cereus TaxID=1396 RepID=A0A9X7G5F2_BACCE|nr:helix-turn-helix domain-containing protein [Bacillus cereus]PED40793.1 capsule biosynthesis protein [Bacillus cereus]PFV02835.1 capsule biosynthesis protein [Bacillus cereus]